MNRLRRLALAAVLGVGSAWMSVGVAVACYCGVSSYAAAIADADVAFVGTVDGADEPSRHGGLASATYLLTVSRSKGPIDSPFAVQALFGDAGDCGVDMAVGEEWLVIASVADGRLRTTLCDGTAQTAKLDAQTRADVDAALVPLEPVIGAPEVQELNLTLPAAGVVATVIVVGACALAFRRTLR